ncbi:hypothetical protein Pint_00692 [Pistacia integerrima]|uniref:Uncharacterized protein n=1 Tax=Pistacia integerrima TaxID=434235 RepID=A0ACC0ZP58_9ROSI|nr:hypothetical protein Pint_00692 [Pistacia integerrima]
MGNCSASQSMPGSYPATFVIEKKLSLMGRSCYMSEEVITKSAMNKIVGACFVAHAVKFFVIQGLNLTSFR